MEDLLGDRMKALEGIESDRKAINGLPLMARLDGRAFHNFTAGLNRPFDERLTDFMVDTTKHVVKDTQAVLGYTQSDEISLMWYIPEESYRQYLFNGRYQKIVSNLSACVSAFFNKHLAERLPEKADELPLFDCRVWQVPTLYEAYETFLFREKDAIKNSITMAASKYFSHQMLHGVSGEKKKAMLREIGHPYEELEDKYKRGTYVQRVWTKRELTEAELLEIPEKYQPTSAIERSDISIVTMPEIGNRPTPTVTFFPSLYDGRKLKTK